MLKTLLLYFTLSSTLAISSSFAWSNSFKIVNELNVPIIVTPSPSTGGFHIDPNCQSGNVIAPHSTSCHYTITDTWGKNEGNILLTQQGTSNSCSMDYSYDTDVISYFQKRSEDFSNPKCQGNLNVNELSIANPRSKAIIRPLVGNVLINLDDERAAKATTSFAEADCGGADNCIILSPDMNTLYQNQGSTIIQALAIQNNLDRFEPLNAEQFIGTHNSAISHYYVHGSDDWDLSHGDPDNYVSLQNQLTDSIRQIELDIQWDDNSGQLWLCHNHVSLPGLSKAESDKLTQSILCNGGYTLTGTDQNTHYVLNDISNWLKAHPSQLIILYFDINHPIDGHEAQFDNALKNTLGNVIFTPAMARTYF